MAEGKINADPLFVGLTRPTLFFGVSYNFFLLNLFINAIFFINSSSFWVLPIGIAIHGLGYALCFKEPLIIELWLIKMQKCNLCKNKMFHGANSYDPF
ncbi:VirB3 family type IV secretion system protein [Rickettsiales endosymbiont of Stachyamoeba lipophora]|uniref:VirB3 family type IV secretion system protein n=1 Tax=Rickettsiales endosymbiont of Stachyamoeba lipophora TaxID=2486578 RepID=UPI000F65055D|nr:VirB3 family type IV secretion system protein [Rickettsiales endosymbiont of Stachyamoeba lipophora]AZL15808.1 type IV secretion system protein VirB3 [Rickettsiales endosymbiont of Stachyamoeba lipophora]